MHLNVVSFPILKMSLIISPQSWKMLIQRKPLPGHSIGTWLWWGHKKQDLQDPPANRSQFNTSLLSDSSFHLHLLYLGGGHRGNSLSSDAPTRYHKGHFFFFKCLFSINRTHVDWLGKQWTLKHPVGGIELVQCSTTTLFLQDPGRYRVLSTKTAPQNPEGWGTQDGSLRSQRWGSPPQSPQPRGPWRYPSAAVCPHHVLISFHSRVSQGWVCVLFL